MRARLRRTDKSEKRRRAGSAAPSLAFRIFRVPHLADGVRLIHQALQIVNESFAAVLGVLVMPTEMDSLLGANLLAVSAENATELIDLEHEWVTIPLLVLTGHEFDAIGWADCRTKSARDTTSFTRFSREHAMRATPARGNRRLLFRILRRDAA